MQAVVAKIKKVFQTFTTTLREDANYCVYCSYN